MNHQLAQLNIARARAALDSPEMQDFVARVGEINALAYAAPGFVWHHQDETEDEVAQCFGEALLVANLSVWADLRALKDFVYRTAHAELIRGRDAWFLRQDTARQVLWWVPAGYRPTLAEAKAKLDLVRTRGPGPEAFTFTRPYPPP